MVEYNRPKQNALNANAGTNPQAMAATCLRRLYANCTHRGKISPQQSFASRIGIALRQGKSTSPHNARCSAFIKALSTGGVQK